MVQWGTAVVSVDSVPSDFRSRFVVVGVGYINASVFQAHHVVDWIAATRLIVARFQRTQRRMDAKVQPRFQAVTFVIIPKIIG